jgi:aerobic-type carbon monoxide dehydrogenase small subunit (CoxS/CutS family)
MRIVLQVNGEAFDLDVAPTRRLVDVLRDDLGLTGTKVGCAEGACGACAVLLDGRPVASCLLLAMAAEGHAVTTIEGLSSNGLTALQEAFVTEDALQCGFCTPGQVVSASALLAGTAQPTRDEIRVAMAGNLCRCGAYPKIERAILRASGQAVA